MRLFHRSTKETAKSILRYGFKDMSDPTGTNLGFFNQIPEIKAVCFNDVPSHVDNGRLFLLEIPDSIVMQLNAAVRLGLWGRNALPHFTRYKSNVTEDHKRLAVIDQLTEYLIPAEMANRYGPPADVTDTKRVYLPNQQLIL